jgi:uncharacterized protein YerC
MSNMKYLEATGLTTEQAKQVKALLKAGRTFLQVEAETGVKYSVVMAIRYGKYFKEL